MAKTKRIIKILMGISLVSWILVIILRRNHIPTGEDQYLIAPWTFFIGLFILAVINVVSAIRKQKSLTNSKSKKSSNIGIGIGFILAFWAFCAIFGMMIVILMPLIFKNSEAFKFISNHIENDQQIQQKIGEVYSYSTLIDGSFGSSNADIHFTVYAEKANTEVYFAGHKEEDGWKIDELQGF